MDWSRWPPCDVCHRPQVICVCDRTQSFSTRVRVLILQHPQEKGRELASAPLVTASLPKAKVSVGLSWRSLSAAVGESVDVSRWAVLFPHDAAKNRHADGDATSCVVLDRHRQTVAPRTLQGVVVLDGTWSQAKTLWWRNAWLLKLPRMSLLPREPSIYGTLRAEPRREYLSTLESVAAALQACGEPESTARALRSLFRTMVQRARDATKHQDTVKDRSRRKDS